MKIDFRLGAQTSGLQTRRRRAVIPEKTGAGKMLAVPGIFGFMTTLLLVIALLLGIQVSPALGQAKPARQPEAVSSLQSAQSLIAKQAALVSEFEVNGLKVLVKRREGSLTVAAGLFIKGGSRNITADNAGIEALMLEAATEASAAFPRGRMRDEQSRMGTVSTSSVN